MGYHIICPEVGDADMSGEFRVTAFVNVFDSTHVVLVDAHGTRMSLWPASRKLRKMPCCRPQRRI